MKKLHRCLLLVGLLAITGFLTVVPSGSSLGSQEIRQPLDTDAALIGGFLEFDSSTGYCVDGNSRCNGIHIQ